MWLQCVYNDMESKSQYVIKELPSIFNGKESSCGIHGRSYMTGVSMVFSIIFSGS